MLTDPSVSIPVFYAIAFLLVMLQILLYERANPGVRVFRIQDYALSEFPWQAGFGILVALGLGSAVILFSPFAPPADAFHAYVFQVMVGLVETVFLISIVETVWLTVPVRGRWVQVRFGRYAWPFVFGISHPVVREAWMSGSFTVESLLGFAYAALFGWIFYALYAGRQLYGPPWNRLLGAVTSWVAHTGLNIILLTWPTRAGSFEVFPLDFLAARRMLFPVAGAQYGAAFVPDWFWWPVLLALAFLFLLLWRSLRSSTRGQED